MGTTHTKEQRLHEKAGLMFWELTDLRDAIGNSSIGQTDALCRKFVRKHAAYVAFCRKHGFKR
jgi:hypothetical protein